MFRLIRLSSVMMILMCLGTTALSQNNTVHIVKKGETLSSIANRYGTTEQELIRLNKDVKNFVYAGMKLTLPSNDKQEPKDSGHTTIGSVEHENATMSIRSKDPVRKDVDEVSSFSFSNYGMSYMASFNSADMGYYMLGGTSYSETLGLEYFFGYNWGLAPKGYNGAIIIIGPSYNYLLSDQTLFSAALDFIGTYSSTGPSDVRKSLNIKKEFVFNWGIALEPRITFKLGKVFPWAGLPIQWAKGSNKLAAGFHIGVGFSLGI